MCELPRLAYRFLRLPEIDQLHRGEEAHSFRVLLDGLNPYRARQMGLACSGATDEYDVLR